MKNALPPVWNPFREGYRENPSEQLRELRDANPVHKGVNGRWVILRYDDDKRLLTDPVFKTVKLSAELASKAKFLQSGENFDSLSAVAAKWFLFFDPPQHTEIRGTVAKIWNTYDTGADIQEITAECLYMIAGKKKVDLIREFAMFVPTRVVCRVVGLPSEDSAMFKVWSYSFNSVFEPFATLHDLREYNRSAEEFFAYMVRVIERKLIQPDNAFISKLLEENKTAGHKLNRAELISLIAFMFFTGIGTSVNFFGQAILFLAANPEQARLLMDSDEIEPTAIEELLRYVSPNQYTVRVASADVEIRGRLIKKGDFILGAIVSANRDPEVFDDPEHLNLLRKKNPHLSFGFGLHYCMGARLAREEISISIAALLKRFPDLRLDPAASPEWDKIILNRGLRSLPVILHA